MKVLRVVCIIFLIIGLLVTAIFFGTKTVVQKEYDSLDNLKSDATETEVLKSKITIEDGTTYITLNSSGDKAEKYTLEKYKKTMNDFVKAAGPISIGCCVFDVLMVAGIVGTTVAVKKRKDD
ncbi:MAG: hypothetical protein IJ871_07060 [Ruminococcus sp.]|nr:hypothetical protein [Ruminococcus sp.]MBR2304883.1 hypothetical protein [Ruminococcus sp.]